MSKRLIELQRLIEDKTDIDDLFSVNRKRNIVDARVLFYKYARDFMGYKLVDITKFTKQNHATVLYAVNKFNVLVEYDNSFKHLWDDVFEALKKIEHRNKIKNAEKQIIEHNKDDKLSIKERAFNKVYSKLIIQGRLLDDHHDDFLTRNTHGIVNEDQLRIMFETAKAEYKTWSYIMGLIEKDNKL